MPDGLCRGLWFATCPVRRCMCPEQTLALGFVHVHTGSWTSASPWLDTKGFILLPQLSAAALLQLLMKGKFSLEILDKFPLLVKQLCFGGFNSYEISSSHLPTVIFRVWALCFYPIPICALRQWDLVRDTTQLTCLSVVADGIQDWPRSPSLTPQVTPCSGSAKIVSFACSPSS